MGNKLTKYKDTQSRIITRIPKPKSNILDINDLFENGSVPNIAKLKEHFEGEGRLSINLVLKIIEMTNSILKSEPNLLRLDSPCNIIGDIHGQFYDLLTIFTLGGSPQSCKYLFMGDFVDRGLFAFECVCYLYCLKIKYPKRIYLIRGNHESRHLTQFFTFQAECLFKSNQLVYDRFMGSFDSLPIACVLDKKFFCVHGGLSPSLKKLSDIENVNRFKEIPKNGLICDLMWSDPIENVEYPFDNDMNKYFIMNSVRGCSYNYTSLAVERFLKENKLLSLIRAHQVQREGVHFSKNSLNSDFPSTITVFSAPNYCDVYKNKAALIKYAHNRFDVKLFTAADHPFVLPNFKNAFSWSLPFIVEKLSELLLFVLNQISDEEVEDDEHVDKKFELNELINRLKDKPVKSAKKANTKKLNDSEIKLGSLTPSNRVRRRSSDIDRELLKDFETRGIKSFEDANKLDSLQYKIINSENEGQS